MFNKVSQSLITFINCVDGYILSDVSLSVYQ